MVKNCRIMRANIAAYTNQIVWLCVIYVKNGFAMDVATRRAVTLLII